MECGALSWLALGPDMSTVSLDRQAAKKQAQANPTSLRDVPSASELVKNAPFEALGL